MKKASITMAKMRLSDKFIISVSVIYVILVSAFMISHRMWFSPDQFFFVALLGVLISGKARIFIVDWFPFLAFYFGYEFLRGLIPFVTSRVHIFPMIHADQALFGFIPTVILQTRLYNPLNLRWYDYVSVICYLSYFVVPMIFGFIFWLKDRNFFKDYTQGYLLLAYAAFITYIIFPAMPPWMASNQGYLPPLQEVTGTVMSHFLPNTFQLPTIYSLVGADQVAAMPSLHAAFPFLVLLFVLKKSWRISLLVIPYVIGVWFAVVYLGEHYVADVIVGTVYATIAFLIINNKNYFNLQFQFLLNNLPIGLNRKRRP
jgi:hypothetical protein